MIWASSWTFRIVWSCSTTARRSATACPTRSRATRRSSTPISASATSAGATMGFFLEVLIGGLLAGVLYSLVALGFVLIFKASGVFNFAQGAMVLTAALALVRALDVMQGQWGWPFGLALAVAVAFAGLAMALVAWGV